MKKIFVLLLVTAIILLQFCTPKSAQVAIPKFTYEANVMPLIAKSCSPCHIPPKGFKKAYVAYDVVKADVDELIRRVQLNPTDRGFMPFKAAAKLPDSVINVLVKWKADGLLEK